MKSSPSVRSAPSPRASLLAGAALPRWFPLLLLSVVPIAWACGAPSEGDAPDSANGPDAADGADGADGPDGPSDGPDGGSGSGGSPATAGIVPLYDETTGLEPDVLED
ncbi:MAG TPA: hypothetical protein VLC09_05220, partial [Polyangiaceae bacterium]|nr:hypothetical protein [Polyangiaceae bacterium]